MMDNLIQRLQANDPVASREVLMGVGYKFVSHYPEGEWRKDRSSLRRGWSHDNMQDVLDLLAVVLPGWCGAMSWGFSGYGECTGGIAPPNAHEAKFGGVADNPAHALLIAMLKAHEQGAA